MENGKKVVFNKLKGSYIRDLKGNSFFDFTSSLNFCGYSNKRITSVYKNAISAYWEIKGNSLYLKRYEKLFSSYFEQGFKIHYANSFFEFFTRLMNIGSLKIIGKDFLSMKLINEIGLYRTDTTKNENTKALFLYDYVDSKIINDNFSNILENLKNQKNESKNILNLYNIVELLEDINFSEFDFVILPKFYFPCSNIVVFLTKEKNNLFDKFHNLTDLSSHNFVLALSYINSFRKTSQKYINSLNELKIYLESNFIIYKNMIIPKSYCKEERLIQLYEKFFEKNIIINYHYPYISYIPYNLLDNEKMKLIKIFEKIRF